MGVAGFGELRCSLRCFGRTGVPLTVAIVLKYWTMVRCSRGRCSEASGTVAGAVAGAALSWYWCSAGTRAADPVRSALAALLPAYEAQPDYGLLSRRS